MFDELHSITRRFDMPLRSKKARSDIANLRRTAVNKTISKNKDKETGEP